jgi:hypothetical protein
MRRNPGQKIRMTRTAIIICAVVVAVVGLAAASLRTSPHRTALARASSGSAVTHFLTADTHVLSARPGALSCFIKAARSCRSASLGVTEMGVDTGTSYLFLIEPGNTSCRVTELRQSYSANFGGSKGAVISVPCHATTVTGRGVALRCAGRRVLIPARVSAPSPQSA